MCIISASAGRLESFRAYKLHQTAGHAKPYAYKNIIQLSTQTRNHQHQNHMSYSIGGEKPWCDIDSLWLISCEGSLSSIPSCQLYYVKHQWKQQLARSISQGSGKIQIYQQSKFALDICLFLDSNRCMQSFQKIECDVSITCQRCTNHFIKNKLTALVIFFGYSTGGK